MTLSRRARVLGTVLALAAVVVVILAAPGFAQRDPAALGRDPRNQPYFESGFCYGHHYPKISPDWVNPSAIASGPAEVVAGEPFTVGFTFLKNWEYDVPGAHAVLNLTGAPGVHVLGENGTDAATVEGEVERAGARGTLQSLITGRSLTHLVTPENPSRLTITLEQTGPSSGTPAATLPVAVDLDLGVGHPDGLWWWSNTTGGAIELVEIPQEYAASAAGRLWNVTVIYKQGVEPVVPYRVTAVAERDPAAMLYHTLKASPMLGLDAMNQTVTWTLVADQPGEIVLDFRSEIWAYHKHTPADEGHTSDDGNITRYDQLRVTVLGEARPVEIAQKGFLPGFELAGAALAVAAAAALAARRRR